jgi:hypothetical protein
LVVFVIQVAANITAISVTNAMAATNVVVLKRNLAIVALSVFVAPSAIVAQSLSAIKIVIAAISIKYLVIV